MANEDKKPVVAAGELVESIAQMKHPLASMLALKFMFEAPETLPTANKELAALVTFLNETLPPAAVAKYWQSSDGKIQRVYVSRKGKKAGYIIQRDNGTMAYEECVAEDLIAAFRAARKAQKASTR